jgi:hypothetical protein
MTAVASRKDPGRTMSGVGGTGSGTGLVGLGFGVGPDTTAGKLLMLVAPATSIVVGGGLFYLHVSVNRWMETRAAGSARATLERAIKNPEIPEEDKKKEFRKQLAEFEKGVVARELERVEALGAVPKASGA